MKRAIRRTMRGQGVHLDQHCTSASASGRNHIPPPHYVLQSAISSTYSIPSLRAAVERVGCLNHELRRSKQGRRDMILEPYGRGHHDQPGYHDEDRDGAHHDQSGYHGGVACKGRSISSQVGSVVLSGRTLTSIFLLLHAATLETADGDLGHALSMWNALPNWA